MLLCKKNQGILPKEYSQLHYIESAGMQYIITDVSMVDQTDIISTIFAVTSGATLNDYAIQAGINGQWALYIGSNSRQNPYTEKPLIVCIGASANKFSELMQINKFYNVEVNPNTDTYYVDGTPYPFIDRWNRYDVTPSSYTLMSYGYNPQASYVKMQRAEVKGKGVFIPCIRNNDNAVGVYNTVTGAFLQNSGTGNFGYETMDGTYIPPIV